VLAAALVLASVTDKLAEFATNVVGDLGLPGIFMLMVLESACIPIPSEATMLFAGFNVYLGEYPLWAAVLAGTLGNLVGSWIAYAVGYYGRLELVERHGNKLHIKQSHLELTERWFAKYGSWAVFFSRMLPIVRTFISLPAGAARMPFWRFTILTLLGCIPWVFALTLIGREVGANWDQWKNSLRYVDYAMAAAIVVGVIVLVVRLRRNRSRGTTVDAAT
jgi:membrane protein DedA with SNARE-associated domain